jgi:hypothetical protein
LVTHAAWDSGKALKHFTTQRMRYGEGVSIPSQRRWVRYVELWAKKLKNQYSSGRVEIIKIQFWGMKVGDGGDKIEVGIAGFVDGEHPGAKAVNKIHVFEDEEVHSLKADLIYRERWKVVWLNITPEHQFEQRAMSICFSLDIGCCMPLFLVFR